MSREIPSSVRAAVGLAATVLDDAVALPRTLTGLPFRVIGLAMQATMRVQQHYAGLVARGDEVLTGLRGEAEPGMATFDEELPEPSAGRTSAFDRAPGFDRETPFDRAAVAVDDEEVAEEAAALVDDELSGLPAEPSPEEVVEALADITDEVAVAGLDLDRAEPGLSTEDALETALLEADAVPDHAPAGGSGVVDTDEIAESPTAPLPSLQDTDAGGAEATAPEQLGTQPPAPMDPGGSPVGEEAGGPDVGADAPDAGTPDATEAPAPSDPGGSPVGEEAGGPDVGADAPDAGTPDTDLLLGDADAANDVSPDVATDVDVLTPDGRIATVEGTVTDEGVAAPEDAAEDTPGEPAQADWRDTEVDEAAGSGASDADTRPSTDDTPAADDRDATGSGEELVTAAGAQVEEQMGAEEDTSADEAAAEPTGSDTAPGDGVATDESGSDVAAATGSATAGEDAADADGGPAAADAPIDGYDDFTIAQLRGRLRGYQLSTVQDLVTYEEATRAREPYLRMLRNRLEKLERQAVESSPLAPRGA
ncbi:hypothetical protein [Geodermatophilus sp. DSM 44513]|uniref:hypothetical protein n=1 Tax=Geodermatophilus sp. DSM 44513 TaxID=1528104 RepID=UPI0028F714B6|nr:hypothetical protein [Geodermatophilus sp. DSM 44513]WNV76493.1 hypothetical protein RTG05_04285 [Geodermatophilus sp. DSM 44513]